MSDNVNDQDLQTVLDETGPGSHVRSRPEPLARGSLYSLLSEVYLHEPTRDFLDGLKKEPMLSALKDLKVDLAQDSKSDEVETLGFEYAHLFLGPGPHLPPFESVNVKTDGKGGHGQMFGPAAREMLRLFKASGLALGQELKDQPDHLAAELAYMAHLCQAESECSDDELNGCRAQQAQFLADHLGTWVPGYLARVIRTAETAFYRQFSAMCIEFISSEQEALSAG